ncbi:MAG: acyl-CoA thioesterase [Ginsengibacter sp.]
MLFIKDFTQSVEIRWSDLDPNFHLRHSVYYDFGAFSRISFLTANGITPEAMLQHNIGPVLFREECVFRKEISFGDKVTINIKLDKLKADFSRWTMVHEIFKNNDFLAALITVDGAWLDTQKRKLALPPRIFNAAFELIPKTDNFKML